MYFYSMLGLSNFKTQKLAQQSQIYHRKCMVIASFKEVISFFELPVIRRSSTYKTIIIKEPHGVAERKNRSLKEGDGNLHYGD